MKNILSMLICALTLALPTTALACSCSQASGWVSDFVENKTIIWARATETKWLGDQIERPFDSNVETQFDVLEGFTRISETAIAVRHGNESAACGIYPTMGRATLIIAYNSSNSKNGLETNSCTMNAMTPITLIEYLETGEDIYVPSRWKCEQQKTDGISVEDNCEYHSEASEDLRREKYIAFIKTNRPKRK